VGIRTDGEDVAADSILAPSLLEAAERGSDQ
jgi:hypothetical protein